MQRIIRIKNVIPRWARNLNSNPLSFKPENILFVPFMSKKHDVTPWKNAKIGQNIKFPKSDENS